MKITLNANDVKLMSGLIEIGADAAQVPLAKMSEVKNEQRSWMSKGFDSAFEVERA